MSTSPTKGEGVLPPLRARRREDAHRRRPSKFFQLVNDVPGYRELPEMTTGDDDDPHVPSADLFEEVTGGAFIPLLKIVRKVSSSTAEIQAPRAPLSGSLPQRIAEVDIFPRRRVVRALEYRGFRFEKSAEAWQHAAVPFTATTSVPTIIIWAPALANVATPSERSKKFIMISPSRPPCLWCLDHRRCSSLWCRYLHIQVSSTGLFTAVNTNPIGRALSTLLKTTACHRTIHSIWMTPNTDGEITRLLSMCPRLFTAVNTNPISRALSTPCLHVNQSTEHVKSAQQYDSVQQNDDSDLAIKDVVEISDREKESEPAWDTVPALPGSTAL
ncbi:MAG: hypothetical protein Q9168_005966 [Polycauliona sp. 1 TL-2023]